MNVLEVLAGNRRAIALRGVVAMLAGIIAFVMPVATLIALVWLFMASALIDGLFNLVAAVRGATPEGERPWWALLLSGIVGVGGGVITFVWPGITAIVLVYLVAAWAVIAGGLEVAAPINLRKQLEGEWLLTLSGLVSILLGGLLTAFPGAGAIGLAWYFGAFGIVFGTLMIVLGYRLWSRNQAHRRASPRMAA